MVLNRPMCQVRRYSQNLSSRPGPWGKFARFSPMDAENALSSEVSPYDLIAMPDGTAHPKRVRRCTVTSALSQSSSKVLDSLWFEGLAG